MALRVCPVAGCPALIPRGHQHCPTHRRGSAHQRGYDHTHRTTRADYQRRMNAGERFTCWRCGKPVDPRDWQLGHDDVDRSVTRGPEHTSGCNLRAAGQAGASVTNN